MTTPAPELLMHFTAGDKAAAKEVVEYVNSKGVATLKVSLKSPLGIMSGQNTIHSEVRLPTFPQVDNAHTANL